MDNCVFCKIIKGELPCWKIYEDDLVIAIFDINPAIEGHTLLIPKKHFRDIYDVPEKYLERIIVISKRLALNYKETLNITDVNLIHGSGKEAQQDVFHFHMHLVPRKINDKFKLHYIPIQINDKFNSILKNIRQKEI